MHPELPEDCFSDSQRTGQATYSDRQGDGFREQEPLNDIAATGDEILVLFPGLNTRCGRHHNA